MFAAIPSETAVKGNREEPHQRANS